MKHTVFRFFTFILALTLMAIVLASCDPDKGKVPDFSGPSTSGNTVEMNGKDGKSAYEYAVEGGFKGTEKEFAEKLAAEYVTPDMLEEALKGSAKPQGEKIVWYALGDSITEGYASRYEEDGSYKTIVTQEGTRWVDHVARINGYELTNYGIGGTGYCKGEKNARYVADSIDFSKCDLVTLAYGINDFKYKDTPIGSMEDDIQKGGTMVSNMRYVIQKILKDNPYCKIIVITPLNYRGLGTYESNYSIGYTGVNASCESLDYLVDLMEEVCLYHGIEMIDMTHSSILTRDNAKALLPDYVHPTVACHEVLGRELAGKILFH